VKKFNVDLLPTIKKRDPFTEIENWLGFEDDMGCSGMCTKGLFYFCKKITEFAYPE
jgi:hypothetical protein